MLPHSRLVDLWDRTKGSYWFVPSIMFVGAVALAVLTIRFDIWLDRTDALSVKPWFPRFEAQAARSILSTLASGMLTVTGVVFSLTVVALQLASSQFGPRLLRTFMESRGTQVVLGTFTSSFVFYLLVIGSVRGDIGFVPQVSTATGIFLGVFDIAILIYAVHHLATSIRIESLLATLGGELRDVIDELFPSQIGDDPEGPKEAATADFPPDGERRKICSTGAGYIRHIDAEMLLSAAHEHDLVVRVEQPPGAFVVDGSVLLCVWPEAKICDEVAKRLRLSIVLGRDRTPTQDVAFAIRLLVEIALRALSPGINDPFTAIECINRLGEALCMVARRPRPSSRRFDDDGNLRVVVRPMSLEEMAHTAFDPIARAGGGNGDVAIRLLETLLSVAACSEAAEDRDRLLGFARKLEQQVQEQMTLERDREGVAVRFRRALAEADDSVAPPEDEAGGKAPLALASETVSLDGAAAD